MSGKNYGYDMRSFLKGNKSEAFYITERIVLLKLLWSGIRKALNSLQTLNQSQAESGLWVLAVPKEDGGPRIRFTCVKEDHGRTGKNCGGRARDHVENEQKVPPRGEDRNLFG